MPKVIFIYKSGLLNTRENMKKVIGYILSILGIAGLALTYEAVRTVAGIAIPELLGETNLMIISLAVLAVGVLFILRGKAGKGSRQRDAEVPIYHGKEIVGYRRVK